MQDEITPSSTDGQSRTTTERRASAWRDSLRNVALENALRKCAAGVPTLSVPEAAALLSVSQEHLYRLIQAENFPAVRLGMAGRQGRYVVPTGAVNALLASAVSSGAVLDAGEWTKQWQTTTVVSGEVA
jgi:excisionase family DNA binding protein